MAKLRKEDYGRRMVDEQLENLEARLTSMYSNAYEEIKAQYNEAIGSYRSEEREMRRRLNDKEITQEEFNNWRMRKYITSNKMQAQMDSMAETMVHADEVAMQMVNGQLPSVYSNSYNFAGFRGERYAEVAGYDYHTFNIYNADAVRILMKEDPDLIPALKAERQVDIPVDQRWNREHIQSAIAQGIASGDSIDQIAQRLQAVAEMDDNAAIRNARTAFTAVENEARRDATERIREAGIPMVEKWISTLDSRTRDTHLMLDGTEPNDEGLFGEGILDTLLRFPGDPNGDASEIYNCRCGVTSSLPNVDHSKDMELYEQFMQQNYYDDWLERKEKEQDPTTYVGAKKLEQEYARERQAELRGEAPEQPTGAHTFEECNEVLVNELGFRYVDQNMLSNLDESFFAEQVNRIDELNAKYGVIHPEDNLGAIIPITEEQKSDGVIACINRPYREEIGDNRADIQSICFNDTPISTSYGYDNRERHIDKIREEVEVTGYSMPCAEEYYPVYNITHEYGHMLEARIISDFEADTDMFDTLFQNSLPELNERFDNPRQALLEDEELMRDYIQHEIESIVLEHYEVDWEDVPEYTSGYGLASSTEFFAEVFANVNCGDPNVLGEALDEWLGRLGYPTSRR